MKTVIFAIAFVGLAQCAKLDHLTYLPPDSRPANKDSFDQGLAAPTSGKVQGSFGTGQQPQANSLEQSRSLEPTVSGSFNAGSQNAAHLQGSPFIPHGSQSGTFGASAPGSQQNQGHIAGQRTANNQEDVAKPSAAPSTFGGSQQVQYSSNIPNQNVNQPQSFFGSATQLSAKPQRTNQFQGSSTFGSQGSAGPQRTNQPHSTYGVPDSQANLSDNNSPQSITPHSSSNIQGSSFGKPKSTSQFQGSSTFGTPGSAGPQRTNQPHSTYGVPDSHASLSDNNAQSITPHSSSNIQGPSFGKPSPSSTFPGSAGPGASIPFGAPFAKNSAVTNNFKSQSTSGNFRDNSQPPGSFGPSTVVDKNVSPSQPGQAYSSTTDQQTGPQSSRSFNSPTGSSDAPRSFGPGKSTGSFNNGPSAQSKYESSANQIPIIRQDTRNYGDGTYSTAYETGNGIQAEEQGQTQGDNTIAQGSYSYTSPEGEKVGVSYTADEDGYHPQGEHLPTPPPIPEAILKSIEYNQAHPEEENDDGSYREPTESESSGQYKSPFAKTQFPGSSNKYLAPTTDARARNQISDSSFSPLVRGSLSATGGRSFASNEPSSNQDTFSSSNNIASSGNNGIQDKSESYISSSDSSGLPTTPNYQSRAPSSSGSTSNGPSSSSGQAYPASSSGNFQGQKTFQGGSRTFPNQQSGFPSHSSFNSPSGSRSGSNSGNLFGKDSNVPQDTSSGHFNSRDSTVSESNSPSSTGNNESYGSTNANIPQNVPVNQFSSHQSISGSSNKPNAQSGSSSNPSYPGTVSGQSSYQNYNNGPVKASGVQQDSGNARFGEGRQYQNVPGAQSHKTFQAYGSGPSVTKSTQYNNLPGPQGHQDSQTSYSSGPNAAKSTQYQNLPGSQGQQGSQTSYSSGPSTAKSTQYQNLPGPQGQQTSQASYSSSPSATKLTQYQNLPGSQDPQGSQASYSSGPSAPKSTQYQNLPGSQGPQSSQASYSSGPSATKSTQSSGYQYNAPNTPFRSSGSSPNFQPGGVSESRSFPSTNAQKHDGSSVSSGPGSSKIIGEFPAGAPTSQTGPARTPGLQAQDENGGYLY